MRSFPPLLKSFLHTLMLTSKLNFELGDLTAKFTYLLSMMWHSVSLITGNHPLTPFTICMRAQTPLTGMVPLYTVHSSSSVSCNTCSSCTNWATHERLLSTLCPMPISSSSSVSRTSVPPWRQIQPDTDLPHPGLHHSHFRRTLSQSLPSFSISQTATIDIDFRCDAVFRMWSPFWSQAWWPYAQMSAI